MRYFKRFILLLCAIWTTSTFAQPDTLPLDRWVKLLSLKKDPHAAGMNEVVNEILQLDSITRSQVMQYLYDRRANGSKYYMAKSIFAINHLKPQFRFFNFPLGSLTETKEMLDLAYEMEDQQLILMGNRWMASFYDDKEEIGQALFHLQFAIEAEKQQDLLLYSLGELQVWYGELLYATREYEAAKSTLLELRRMAEDSANTTESLHINQHIFLYNTLGLCYEKLGQYDSAMLAFKKALPYSQYATFKEWHQLIEGNMGDIYFLQGNYDSARVLLEKDVVASSNNPFFYDNAANSLQWLARIEVFNGHPEKAIQMLREAEKFLQSMPNEKYLSQIYYACMMAWEKLGRADSVFNYAIRYQSLHDRIEQKAALDRIDIVEIRMINNENLHKIDALNKQKRRVALIRNFFILLCIMFAVYAYLYIQRKRAEIRLREHIVLEEKRKAEIDARTAREQLNVFTNNLIEKNKLVDELQEKLSAKELNEEQLQTISILAQHTILTDEDWERFKSLFEKVYPGFFHHLKNKAPDITLAEQRMAALAKLHVSNKEASHLLGISHASVTKTKQRLRSRLSFENDNELENFIQNIN